MRLAIFLPARAGVTDLDCQKAISGLLGTQLDTQRMSAGPNFSPASCCGHLQEITAVFCTTSVWLDHFCEVLEGCWLWGKDFCPCHANLLTL